MRRWLSYYSATRLSLLAICAATLSACSSSPRFTGRSPVEPSREPSKTATASRVPPAGAGNVVQEFPDPRSDSMTTQGARGNEVVELAEEFLGTPYRSGGTSTNGVDCSGLTYAVYKEVGVKLPRSSDDQARVGEPVSRDELAPGDLVFFGSGSNVSHVGIYTGGGEFIHASTSARSVRFDRLDAKYFDQRFVTARRVM
jgi:cell wall-associated NlpC family hydrolase